MEIGGLIGLITVPAMKWNEELFDWHICFCPHDPSLDGSERSQLMGDTTEDVPEKACP